MMPTTGILFSANRWSDHLFWLFSEVSNRHVISDGRDEHGHGDCLLDSWPTTPEPEPRAEPTEPRVREPSPHSIVCRELAKLDMPVLRSECSNEKTWRELRNAAKRLRQARRGKR